MEDAPGDAERRTHGDAHNHIPPLAYPVPRQEPLRIVLEKRREGWDHNCQRANPRKDVPETDHARTQPLQQAQPEHPVHDQHKTIHAHPYQDAGQNRRKGRDRLAVRVGKPRVQRHDGVLDAESDHEHQQDEQGVARRGALHRPGQGLDLERAATHQEAGDRQQHGTGAHDRHHHVFQPCGHRLAAPITDDQIRAPTHDLPEHVQRDQVAAQHDAQHRPVHEQHGGIIEIQPLLALHVTHREEDGQETDGRDRHRKEPPQRIQPKAQRHVEERQTVIVHPGGPAIEQGKPDDRDQRHQDRQGVPRSGPEPPRQIDRQRSQQDNRQ